MAPWRDDGINIYPGDIVCSGTCKGKPAVEAWYQRFLEQFPQIKYDVHHVYVSNIFDCFGNNEAAAYWTATFTTVMVELASIAGFPS